MLAAVLLAAALAKTAFINLPQLVASDPLYPVLRQYDREIATLRDTQHVEGLTRVAGTVANDATHLRTDASAVQDRVSRIAAAHANALDRREALLLKRLGSPATVARDSADFSNESARAANATLQSYRQALATRTERALEARSQELREKESTLAFDLEKRSSGKSLLLQLKLRDLRLSKAQRTKLEGQLAALDAQIVSAVRRMQAADAGILAAYRGDLLAQQARDDAQMASQIRAKSAANVQSRANVTPAALPPDSAYRFADDAASIKNGFAAASSDLSGRFGELALADRASQRDTGARITALHAARESLLAAIVARALQTELASL